MRRIRERHSKSVPGIQTVKTTYRDFESREYLNEFVNELVQHALAKFLDRHNTRIDVTLDNSEKRTRRRLFSVGITLHPAHHAPIHITREADRLQDAIRDAVSTIKKILRRDHAKQLARRRRYHAQVA